MPIIHISMRADESTPVPWSRKGHSSALIAELLAESPGVRPEDVFVNIADAPKRRVEHVNVTVDAVFHRAGAHGPT